MKLRRWASSYISPTSSAFRRKRKRQWRSPCSPTKRGIGVQATCRQPRERSGRRSWERSRMHKAGILAARRKQVLRFAQDDNSFQVTFFPRTTTLLGLLGMWALVLPLLSCSQAPDPNTLVMIIESSPTNLDPRVGIDAQSERIGELLFDALLTRDEHL